MASISSDSNFQFVPPPASPAAANKGLLAAHEAEVAKRNKPQQHHEKLKAINMGEEGRADRRDRRYSVTRLKREKNKVGTSKQERSALIDKRRQGQARTQALAPVQVVVPAPTPAPAQASKPVVPVQPASRPNNQSLAMAAALVKNTKKPVPKPTPIAIPTLPSSGKGNYSSSSSQSAAASAAAAAAAFNPLRHRGSQSSAVEGGGEGGAWCSSPTETDMVANASARKPDLAKQKAALATQMRLLQEQLQQRVKGYCDRLMMQGIANLERLGPGAQQSQYVAAIAAVLAQVDQLSASLVVKGASTKK